MSIFGGFRDYNTMIHFNRELLHDIIEQKIGYYKINLDQTPSNVYGESSKKSFNDPVLLNCLIDRGDKNENTSNTGVDISRNIGIRLIRQDMIDAELFPENGDIIMWNEDYYEVTIGNDNQYFLGKNPEYSYADTTTDFGGSLSIILSCNYVRPESLGLTQERL